MKKWVYIGLLFLCVAGSFAAGRLLNQPKQDSAHRVLYYVDPMHPSYKSPKPGIAPDCGMDLVPVYADSAANSIAPKSAAPGTAIDPAVQQLYGIRPDLTTLGKVIGGGLPIAAYGEIAYDKLTLQGLVISLDGKEQVRVRSSIPWTAQTSVEYAGQMGVQLAEQALAQGAAEIIETVNERRVREHASLD